MAKGLKTIKNGLLIFFEGIDGVGKTTQLEFVRSRLSKDNWLVKTSRIHGGTPMGEALREVSFLDVERPPASDLYISLEMHQALIEQVNQWRDDGAIILIDRSPLSIMAYQVTGDGLDYDLGWRSTQESMRGFAPELTILYTADIKIAMSRTRLKHGWADNFSRKPETYFKRAQQGYLDVAGEFTVRVVDANQPKVDVKAQTWQLVAQKLSI